MSKTSHQEITCASCKEPYRARHDGAFGAFCPFCRHDWGIRDEQDAKDILDMFNMDLAEWKEKRQHTVRDQQSGKFLPAPKTDPAVVAEGLRQMIDYKVGAVEQYEKPITYVTCKNGLFEVRHSDLATIITKPKEVLGVLEEGHEGIQLNIPKIPLEFLNKTVSFFRGVCKRERGTSEALVQVWWDRQEKIHTMHVPAQSVSGGGVQHQSTFDQDAEGRWLHVADIHSHGSSMGAFWSGTDDGDERRVTTERLFGVIGKVDQPIPEWRWRMRTRDGFIDLQVTDIFDMTEEKHAFTVTSTELFKAIAAPGGFKDGLVSLWCPVNPFTDVEIPEEWYQHVSGYRHEPQQQGLIGFNRGYHQPSYPTIVKGYIYVDNCEYEIDGTTMRATGHQLIKKQQDHQ